MATRRFDVGLLAVAPIAALLAVGNAVTFVRSIEHTSGGAVGSLLQPTGAALVAAFYGLVVVVYFRRTGAAATTPSARVKLAAAVGGWLPLVFPYTAGHDASTALLAIAEVLMTAGMAWSIVALRTLGRSFSIVPQARAVVRTGPYAVVRHPLYLGEIVAALGVVLRAPSVPGLSLWVLLLALQAYRTRHEERVLADALPDYPRYRAATRWRIVPGLL